MKVKSRKFTSKFKAQIVLQAISEKETIGEIARRYDIHRTQISNWKKEFLERAHLAFEQNDNKLME